MESLNEVIPTEEINLNEVIQANECKHNGARRVETLIGSTRTYCMLYQKVDVKPLPSGGGYKSTPFGENMFLSFVPYVMTSLLKKPRAGHAQSNAFGVAALVGRRTRNLIFVIEVLRMPNLLEVGR